MSIIDFKIPKFKFKKMKMNVVDELENIDYEKLQKKNLKQKRTTPYEDSTHYKTVKEFFLKAVKDYPNEDCILEKPNHKDPYKVTTYKEFKEDVFALGTALTDALQLKNERVMITTLTIRMAEELTNYLKELDIKVAYLHSEVKTLERMQIIHDVRTGKYDVLVGINLLREGLDIPEVSLIAILDADKEGFLRSTRSLIQTIGRCARNSNGHVIMYGDKITDSMNEAITETKRRREIQEEYNEKHGIVPKTIIKDIREVISNIDKTKDKKQKMSKKEIIQTMNSIEEEMKEAARNLDFERAMELRDILFELKTK